MKGTFSVGLLAAAFAVTAARAEFIGDLEFIPAGCEASGMCTIKNDFEYKDPAGMRWQTKAQDKTDGASIPSWAQPFVGAPFTKEYIKAAVIHDHYCKTKLRSWADTHAAFYESMIASGEDKKKALLMWAAVYRFGPRWAQNQSVCWGTCAGDPAYLENVDIVPTFVESEYSKIADRVSAGGGHPLRRRG